MKNLLLIYAAVLFIAGVIVFTVSELKKDKDNESEPETNTWTKVLAGILVVLAAVCLVTSIRSQG
jgi:hypothetical protein